MEDCHRRETENFDNETGEIRQAVICLRSERLSKRSEGDAVEAEPPVEAKTRKKKCFQVPISYVQGHSESERGKTKGCKGRETIRPVDCLEESVIHGTQNVSPIVFMLPTLLIFPAWTSIVCILCEACIHMLSHKRNKMKKYETEYKSPLHLISSEFCGYCRSHRWKEKIKRIQDKRSMRRKFSHANVIGQVLGCDSRA